MDRARKRCCSRRNLLKASLAVSATVAGPIVGRFNAAAAPLATPATPVAGSDLGAHFSELEAFVVG